MLEKYLIFDVETTGLPLKRNAKISDVNNWPRIVQLAFGIYDNDGNCLEEHNYIIKPNNYSIPENSIKIHKITNEYALENGDDINFVLNLFLEKIQNVNYLVAHNLKFDKTILESELYRNNIKYNFENLGLKEFCTMESSTEFCKLLPFRYNKYKWPKLEELHSKLFNNDIVDGFHNALVDIQICKKCLFKLKELNIINI